MKFDVSYIRPAFARRISPMQPIGAGQILLEDTGLILLGLQPRFYLPLLLEVYVKVSGVESIRTLPYGHIREHRVPNELRTLHRLRVASTDSERAHIVTFKMTKPRRKHDQQFSERLRELMTLTAQVGGSRPTAVQ